MHLAIGILTALRRRDKTGKGQKVAVSMQDSVLNLCRVKLRDQQRLDRVGYLEEYPQYPHGAFTDVVPRGGNAGGGGQPGWVLKCKGWETDPNAYIYFTIQGHAWEPICEAIGKPEWIDGSAYNDGPGAPAAHLRDLRDHRGLARRQDQVRGGRHPAQVRHSLRAGAVDEGTCSTIRRCARAARSSKCDHKDRGKYLTVGSPIKFSDMNVEITGSPLLGEHTDEVLSELGYSKDRIQQLHAANAV